MKKRFVFVTFLIAMFVLTQIPVSLVHAATSNGTEYQLALNFLERVAGMNVSEYTVLSSNVFSFRMLDSQRYQTDVRIVISNNNHTSDVLITFVDGKFWIYNLNLSPVQLVGDKTLNDCLSIAKRAIEEYRAGFNATYLDGLEEMISVAIQNQSLIVENDNTLLKISYIEDYSTPLDYKRYTKLQWFKKIEHQYTVPAQSFSLSVSKDGLLTMLMDNLAIYYVASTEINVSEGEAINVSMPYAEVYAREHGQGIVSVNATLNWVRDLDSLRGNDSAIYPVWIVSMTYNKTNEESVFGYGVLIWADNCEIIRHGPRIFLETTNGSHNPYLWLILVPIPIILAFICLMTYSRRKDKNKKG